MRLDDQHLLEHWRTFRTTADFEQLVARHGGWIHAVALRRVRDEHLASDVLQAVFICLAERPQQLRDPTRLGAWLFGITMRTANQAMRSERRRRTREQSFRPLPEAVSAIDSAIRHEELAALDNALARLRKSDREILVRRYYAGLTLEQISAELRIGVDAARKRIERAVDRLRIKMSVRSSGPVFSSLATLRVIHGRLSGSLVEKPAHRSIHLFRGVQQMLQLRKAAVISVSFIITGLACVAVLGHPYESPASTPPAVAASTAPRWIEATNLMVIASSDHTKLTGYSKLSNRWATLDGEQFALDHLVASSDVAIYTSEDAIYGFSSATATWSKAELATPTTASQSPLVATRVAAFVNGDTVWAYSGVTGAWASLRLPNQHPEPVVSDMSVSVDVGGKMYLFGQTSGKWSDGL